MTYADGKIKSYVYEKPNLPHHVTGTIDESGGRYLTVDYNYSGQVVESTLAGGVQRLLFNYSTPTNGRGLVEMGENNVNDYYYRAHRLEYESANNSRRPIAASDRCDICGLNFSKIAYDANDRILKRVALNGLVDFYQYDALGRVTEAATFPASFATSTTRPTDTTNARIVSTAWHPQWDLPVTRTEGPRQIHYTYDTAGNMLTEQVIDTSASPSKTSTRAWTYTAKNQVATETDEVGGITTHTYDASGNRTTTVDARGKTTVYTYDAAGRALTVTSPEGIVTSYTYDLRGRPLTQSVGGLVTTMTYLPTGLLATLTQPNGYAVTYQYDGAHRLTGWTDNRGASAQFTLDRMNNRRKEEVRNAQSTVVWGITRRYTDDNRLESETVYPNQATTYQYAANGEVASEMNALNQKTTFDRDALMRVAAVTAPHSANATLGYNSLDAVTQATDFIGVTTTYSRDAQGNAPSEVSPDIGTTTNTFDPRGLPSSSQDAAGRTQSITRDALGRPTGISYGAGATSTLTYE